MSIHITRKSRISPQRPVDREHIVPLSLLDATTANLGLTSAIWLLERPTLSFTPNILASYLRSTLSIALTAYPQWCGFLKGIHSIDQDTLPPETTSFPAYAKRYGRLHVQYGTSTDPGVEFVAATSTATVDSLYNAQSAKRRPVWNRKEEEVTLARFVPPTDLVLALEPSKNNSDGQFKPIMAAQCTELACGGLVLAAKIAHSLADIAALARFVRDWSSVTRAVLTKAPLPVLSPIFDPPRLDAYAAGDLNANYPDSTIMQDALSLPLHSYDGWAPPAQPPSPFTADLPLAGDSMPWAEWDTKAPVDRCTVHLSKKQIDHLWQAAVQKSSLMISKHDNCDYLGSRSVVPCDIGSGADGVVPCVYGCILNLDSPPTETTSSSAARGWTENGVDITLDLRCEDMERFLRDPLLLPRV